MPGREVFEQIVDGQYPSGDSKSTWLHVSISRFCFHSFEVYYVDSSKLIGSSPEVSNFNQLFLFYFETKGQHVNVKAHEAVDHLASFVSSKEEIS